MGGRICARALLEGCAFAMRDVADRLRDMGAEMRSLLLLGGGARSRLWAQMRADIMGLPALVPHRVDTSPIGAAVLAGVAAGLVENLRTAAELVQEPVAPLAPVPANQRCLRRCLRGDTGGSSARSSRCSAPAVSPIAAAWVKRARPGGRRAMSKDMIAQLVEGSLPDPDGGSALRVATRSVVIAPSLQGSEADIVAPLELGRHLAVVSDLDHARAARRARRTCAGQPRTSHQHRPARTAAPGRRHRRVDPR